MRVGWFGFQWLMSDSLNFVMYFMVTSQRGRYLGLHLAHEWVPKSSVNSNRNQVLMVWTQGPRKAAFILIGIFTESEFRASTPALTESQ